MIEIKSLILGLICCLGAFAVKVGAGLAYLQSRRNRFWEKAAITLSVGAGYLVIFIASWYVGARFDVVRYFNTMKALFQSGMVIHFVVAGGLLIWAALLLRRRDPETPQPTYGWIPLVIPCPVCASVIFLSTTFIVGLAPERATAALLWCYGIFAGLTLTASILFGSISRLLRLPSETLLGLCMLFIASYFLVSVLIVPHFSDLEKVYRLAAYSAQEDRVNSGETITLLAVSLTVVAVGFFRQSLRQRW